MEFRSYLSSATLSRYNIINAYTHMEILCKFALNSLDYWWDYGHEYFNFDI